MRHLYLLGLLYAGVLGASCTAEDKNLVLKEDFEDISNSQFFSKLEFNGETVSEGTRQNRRFHQGPERSMEPVHSQEG